MYRYSSMILIFWAMAVVSAKSQDTADGRWLDEETWQPRNQQGTIDNSPGNGGDWPVVTGFSGWRTSRCANPAFGGSRRGRLPTTNCYYILRES